jgi:hypothetical protein
MCTLCILVIVAVAQVSVGDVPQTMSYQGVLKNADGSVVADGDYGLTFRIYDSDVAGTELWSEIQTVTVTGGIFGVILGGTTPREDGRGCRRRLDDQRARYLPALWLRRDRDGDPDDGARRRRDGEGRRTRAADRRGRWPCTDVGCDWSRYVAGSGCGFRRRLDDQRERYLPALWLRRDRDDDPICEARRGWDRGDHRGLHPERASRS